MTTFALLLAGMIFTIVAVLHFVRYNKAWEIVVNHFTVPVIWSLYGGLVSVMLALIMFLSL